MLDYDHSITVNLNIEMLDSSQKFVLGMPRSYFFTFIGINSKFKLQFKIIHDYIKSTPKNFNQNTSKQEN